MEVKDLIKMRRLEKRLTMRELAKKVGVSAPTISRWESGFISSMRQSRLAKLAEALDVTPAELVPDVEAIKKSQLPPDEERLVKAYRKLDEDSKQEIYKFIEVKLLMQYKKSYDTEEAAL